MSFYCVWLSHEFLVNKWGNRKVIYTHGFLSAKGKERELHPGVEADPSSTSSFLKNFEPLSFSTKAEEVWLEGHFRYLINVPENPSWRGEASKESICNKGNTNQLPLLYEVLLLEEFLSKKTRTVPN